MKRFLIAWFLALSITASGIARTGDSVDLIINAAESGDDESQYFLAKLYETGAGDLEKDNAKAAYWLKKASDAGNLDARCEVAVRYLHGIDGYPIDKAKAFAMLQENAKQNHPASLREMGRLFDAGMAGFITQDERKAFNWFMRAAEVDDSLAAVFLGYYYEMGKGGVKQDYAKALTWYQKGVSQLDPSAMNNIGVMYYHGKGVARDIKEARRWWQIAAKFGSKDAERNLEIIQDAKEE